MGAWAKTSSMASASGAIAAVDGDFSIWPGRPQHPFLEDGQLKQTGVQVGSSFGERLDETRGYIRHEKINIRVTDPVSKAVVRVASWNSGAPAATTLAGFSPYGGDIEKPEGTVCSARLKPSGKLRWGQGEFGLFHRYLVVRHRCGTALPVEPGTVVLTSRTTGDGALFLKGLTRGQRLRLRWNNGMRGVMDLMGGAPMLVRNSLVVASQKCSNWFCERQPRTGVGILGDGRVIMVVVDGRSSRSVGMTIFGFAKYLQSLGAVRAFNLDGGGSATMWVRGQGVVNEPTDSSGERPVTNALVILPGQDTKEPVPAGAKGRSVTGFDQIVVGPGVARRAMAAALTDPGSTGGLMDWMVGTLGASAASRLLGPASLRMAARFRASAV
jgi:hypothetical protein